MKSCRSMRMRHDKGVVSTKASHDAVSTRHDVLMKITVGCLRKRQTDYVHRCRQYNKKKKRP
jgi:transposase-like protein